ncbi:hypothetical protein TNCV_1381641 [Trichonephila clavipes]|nr:hypothetical protein TNCV_1381641 [Trichonephila clavipes]
MDEPICYELRVILIATGKSVKSPSFKTFLELSFNRFLYVAMTVRDFYSVQHMQLLPSPGYSSHMSPLKHVWYLVDLRLPRDLRPAASKDEILLRIQAIRNSLPQADIQNLLDSMPRRIAALIAARGGYTKC